MGDDVDTVEGEYDGQWSGATYTFAFGAGYGNVQVEGPERVDDDSTLTFDWHIDLDVTNQESLAAYPPARVFGLEGAWPLTSPLCTGGQELDVLNGLVRYPTADGFGTIPEDTDFPYCLVPLASLSGEISEDLQGAAEIEASGHQVVNHSSTRSVDLPNDFASIAADALREGPVFWISDPFSIEGTAPIEACQDAAWSSDPTCGSTESATPTTTPGVVSPHIEDALGELNGECEEGASTIGFPDATTYVAACGPDVAIFDLSTRTVAWLRNDEYNGELGDSGDPQVTLSGHTLAWSVVTQYEAEGLDPASWDVTFTLYDIETGETTDLPIVEGGSDQAPELGGVEPIGNDFGFHYAVPRSGLPGPDAPYAQLVQLSTDGTVMWTREIAEGMDDRSYYALELVTTTTGIVDDGQVLVDLRTGNVIVESREGGAGHEPDACRLHSTLTSDKSMWLTDTRMGGVTQARLNIDKFPSAYGDDRWHSPAGGLEVTNDGINMIAPDGTKLWGYPDNIATDAWAVGQMGHHHQHRRRAHHRRRRHRHRT